MLQFSRIPRDRAVAVRLHVHVDAAVTEDEARGGQNRGVCAQLPTQRAAPAVTATHGLFTLDGRRLPAAAVLLLQMKGGWRNGQGGESFHCAVVV